MIRNLFDALFSTLHIIIIMIKFHTSFFCWNLLWFDPWFAFPIMTHLLHKQLKHEKKTHQFTIKSAEISTTNKPKQWDWHAYIGTYARKTKESNKVLNPCHFFLKHTHRQYTLTAHTQIVFIKLAIEIFVRRHTNDDDEEDKPSTTIDIKLMGYN